MRCYHFNNMYLSGIHAGIQSAHAQQELTIKYLVAKPQFCNKAAKKSYLAWTQSHKTMCVLNGGCSKDLRSWIALLSQPDNTCYAWASFAESDEALDGALTNIALVLPEKMYKYNRYIVEFMNDKVFSKKIGNDLHIQLNLQDNDDVIETVFKDSHKTEVLTYSLYEVMLIQKMAGLKLMA